MVAYHTCTALMTVREQYLNLVNNYEYTESETRYSNEECGPN